jgi:hypothetical protein
MGLCKLWRGGRREVEGCALLGKSYSSFTEGLDTPVLVEARVVTADGWPQASPDHVPTSSNLRIRPT